MKIRADVDILHGASTNSDWGVSTEHGMVYDIHTAKRVSGFILKCGHLELVVTDDQADMLVDYIRGEFLRVEREESKELYDELEQSMRKHRESFNADE